MTIPVGKLFEVAGVPVRVLQTSSGHYYAENPATHDRTHYPKYLTEDGRWEQFLIRLFYSIEEVELTLAKGALTDWLDTKPNPPAIVWGRATLKMQEMKAL